MTMRSLRGSKSPQYLLCSPRVGETPSTFLNLLCHLCMGGVRMGKSKAGAALCDQSHVNTMSALWRCSHSSPPAGFWCDCSQPAMTGKWVGKLNFLAGVNMSECPMGL